MPSRKPSAGDLLHKIYLYIVQHDNRGLKEEEFWHILGMMPSKRTFNHLMHIARVKEGVPFYTDGQVYYVDRGAAVMHRLLPPPPDRQLGILGRSEQGVLVPATSHESVWSGLDMIEMAEKARPSRLTKTQRFQQSCLHHNLLGDWWPGRAEWIFTLPLIYEIYEDRPEINLPLDRKNPKSLVRQYLDYKLDPDQLIEFLMTASYANQPGYYQLVVEAVQCCRYIYWDPLDQGTRSSRRWTEYMKISEIFAARHFHKLCAGVPLDKTTLQVQVLELKGCMPDYLT